MKKVLVWTSVACLLIWSVVVISDYWYYHELQRQAVQMFVYTRLAGIVAIFLAIFALVTHFFRDRMAPYVTGVSVLVLGLILMTLSVQAFGRVNNGTPFATYQVIQFLFSNVYTLASVFLVFFSAYCGGDLLVGLSRYGQRTRYFHLLRFGVGLMLLTMLLFFLGVMKGLLPVIVWILILIFPVVNYRRALWFLRLLFIRPISAYKKMNGVGVVAFGGLLWWATLNLVYVNRPFPLGFDAMSLYVNVSSLLADYQGLVPGNSMYNWSIFASLGYLLFDSTAITLAISYGGGLLAIFSLFAFAKKYVDTNLAMLVCALFYAMPLTNWLSYKDMKIDMPLLFFLLLMLMILEELFRGHYRKKEGKTKKKKKGGQPSRSTVWDTWKKPAPWQLRLSQRIHQRWPERSEEWSLIILLGCFSGFVIGIKLTAVFMLFLLISGLFYRAGGQLAFVFSVLLMLGLSLAVGLDVRAGLRYFNLGAVIWQWAFMVVGGGGLIYLFLQKKADMFTAFRQIVVVGSLSGVMLLPWLAKHAVEVDSISFDGLLMGRSQHPEFNTNEITRIYESLEKLDEE